MRRKYKWLECCVQVSRAQVCNVSAVYLLIIGHRVQDTSYPDVHKRPCVSRKHCQLRLYLECPHRWQGRAQSFSVVGSHSTCAHRAQGFTQPFSLVGLSMAGESKHSASVILTPEKALLTQTFPANDSPFRENCPQSTCRQDRVELVPWKVDCVPKYTARCFCNEGFKALCISIMNHLYVALEIQHI